MTYDTYIILSSLKEMVDKNLSYQNPAFFDSFFGSSKLTKFYKYSYTGFLIDAVRRISIYELKYNEDIFFINGLTSYDEMNNKFITLLQSMRRIQYFLPETYQLDALRWMKEKNISLSCIKGVLNNQYLFFNKDKRVLDMYKNYLEAINE